MIPGTAVVQRATESCLSVWAVLACQVFSEPWQCNMFYKPNGQGLFHSQREQAGQPVHQPVQSTCWLITHSHTDVWVAERRGKTAKANLALSFSLFYSNRRLQEKRANLYAFSAPLLWLNPGFNEQMWPTERSTCARGLWVKISHWAQMSCRQDSSFLHPGVVGHCRFRGLTFVSFVWWQNTPFAPSDIPSLTWLLMSALLTWAIVMNLRLFLAVSILRHMYLYDWCPLRAIKCWCQLKRNFKHTWCNQRHNAKRQVSKTSQNNTPSPP